MPSTPSLIERAQAVLALNDRGRHTVPSNTLYPHQWAWDSAFAAIGWSCLDTSRALSELETLMNGQWADGRVPHIQFSPNVTESYFPDARFWEAADSSSITQPPVWAIAAQRIFARGGDSARIKALLPAIERSHMYFERARDPLSWGLVSVAHPWESGLDNSPTWDQPLSAVNPSLAPQFQRVDKAKVKDAKMRPTDDEYKRYAVLVKAIAADGFGHGPFQVYCPLMTALLARSERALASLCEALSVDSEASRRAARLMRGLERLYDEERGLYSSYDISSAQRCSVDVLGAYAPIMLKSHQETPVGYDRMIKGLIERYAADYILPTTSPHAEGFDPDRYWRGPVWVNMNWLFAEALEEVLPLKEPTLKLVERAGFYEYFNPQSGEGLGSEDFTWSAALCLDWLSDHEGT